MAWILTVILIALVALTATYALIAPGPKAVDYRTASGAVGLATVATFLLLQILLVAGVCTCRSKLRSHNHNRK